MSKYLYLSIMPETLVASMLPPEEFGTYLAVGSQRKLPRETMFFSIDPGFTSDFFDLSLIEKACVPHQDGLPKHSLYISVYRVLENIPLPVIRNLYLVTRDGQVLEISPAEPPGTAGDEYHLYAELCPVNPLAMSSLAPKEFCNYVIAPSHPLHIPKICFMNLKMPDLTVDDTSMGVSSVHAHIIETYKSMVKSKKKVKIVDRRYQLDAWHRHVKDGFFVGDIDKMLFFPFPSPEKMELKHHKWWRSATL